MKKRILALILALCLCVSLFPGVSAMDEENSVEADTVSEVENVEPVNSPEPDITEVDTSDILQETAVMETAQAEEANDATYDVTFTVYANGVLWKGARICVYSDGVQIGEAQFTNDQGRAVVSGLPSGVYTYTVSCSGYNAIYDQSMVINRGNQNIMVTVPSPTVTTYPVEIPVQDNDGNALDGVTVTLTKDGNFWASEKSASGKVTFSLPEHGSWQFSATKHGYKNTVGNIAKANGHFVMNIGGAIVGNIQLTTSGLPAYTVRGENTEDDTYVLEVFLKGTSLVTHGSFGLDYDEEIFELQSFTILDTLSEFEPAGLSDLGADPLNHNNAAEGYHTFGYKSLTDQNIDASAADGVKLGTYVFQRKPDASDDLSGVVDSKTFRILDFSTTDLYKTLAENPTVGETVLNEIWKQDENGNPSYQIWSRETAGEEPSAAPAEMEIVYAEQSERKRVYFAVYEGTEAGGSVVPDESKPLAGAVISVYNAAGELVGTTTTDIGGVAHASLSPDSDYTYLINGLADTHWPAPGGYAQPEQRGTITAQQIANNAIVSQTGLTVTEGMLPKVKGTVSWDLGDDSEGRINGTAAGTGEAVLHEDYAFRAQSVRNFMFGNRGEDKKISYTVTDTNGNVMTNGDRTLENQPAQWDISIARWVVPGEDVLGNVQLNLEIDESQEFKCSGHVRWNKEANLGGIVTAVDEPKSGVLWRNVVGGSLELMDVLYHSKINRGDPSVMFHFQPDEGAVIDYVVVSGSGFRWRVPDELVRGKTSLNYQLPYVYDSSQIYVGVTKPTDDGTLEKENGFVYATYGMGGVLKEIYSNGAGGGMTLTYSDGNHGGGHIGTAPLGDVIPYQVFAVQDYDCRGRKVSFVIDELYVDGEKIEEASGARSYDVPIEVTGDHHSLMVSFKLDEPDAPTLQHFVHTEILAGKGYMFPCAQGVYDAGSDVNIDMEAAEGWSIDYVLIDGVKADLDELDKLSYACNFMNLDSNHKVSVAFKPDTAQAVGNVKIASTALNDAGYLATGAYIEFATKEDGKTYVYTPDSADKKSDKATGADRLSHFAVDVPVGTYTLTVHKEGYLDYVITDFEVTKADIGNSIEIPTIVLVPGDASWDRALVSNKDMNYIILAWDNPSDTTLQTMADIDESGTVAVEDMAFVKRHYGEHKNDTTVTWAKFKNKTATS